MAINSVKFSYFLQKVDFILNIGYYLLYEASNKQFGRIKQVGAKVGA